jgi:hypothetical protein
VRPKITQRHRDEKDIEGEARSLGRQAWGFELRASGFKLQAFEADEALRLEARGFK